MCFRKLRMQSGKSVKKWGSSVFCQLKKGQKKKNRGVYFWCITQTSQLSIRVFCDFVKIGRHGKNVFDELFFRKNRFDFLLVPVFDWTFSVRLKIVLLIEESYEFGRTKLGALTPWMDQGTPSLDAPWLERASMCRDSLYVQVQCILTFGSYRIPRETL